MKKVLLVVAAAGFLLATPSCKKGVNDPAMSLSSRKARLAGEWNVASTESTWSDTYTNGDIYAGTELNNGSAITSTWTSTVDGVISTGIGEDVITVNAMEYIINKDGSWSSVFNKTTVTTTGDSDFKVVTTIVETNNTEGVWSFLGGNKGNYKNKERVEMLPNKIVSTSETTVATTFSGTTTSVVTDKTTNDGTATNLFLRQIYDIDMLKGKEMVWKLDSENSNTSSSVDSEGVTTTESSSGSSTYEIKFVAK